MIARMEKPGDRDLIGRVRGVHSGWLRRHLAQALAYTRNPSATDPAGMRFVVFQILDSYVLSSFLFYFVLWLCGCSSPWCRSSPFSTCWATSSKNHVPMSHVMTYHLFLTPQLIYNTLPIAVLVAVLVTFGVMTKNNEVTAFKACGISVRRLAACRCC